MIEGVWRIVASDLGMVVLNEVTRILVQRPQLMRVCIHTIFSVVGGWLGSCRCHFEVQFFKAEVGLLFSNLVVGLAKLRFGASALSATLPNLARHFEMKKFKLKVLCTVIQPSQTATPDTQENVQLTRRPWRRRSRSRRVSRRTRWR